MRVARCPEIRRELKALCKNRPFLTEAIIQFERLLISGTIVSGDLYGGLGLVREREPATIYKQKVFVPKSGGGKQSGVRYVYEVLEVDGDQWALCLGIYLHVGQDDEARRREDYRDRFGAFDLTELEDLEEYY